MTKEIQTPEWVRNMQRLMDEQSLNPRKLSLLAGLNATAVRDMIEGRSRFPRYDTVQALAAALNTTPAFLMNGAQTGTEIQSKGEPFNQDIELLTEIIARLQETASEMERDLTPREFAAMSVTIYRRLQEDGKPATRKSRVKDIKPQIHDLLEYESLRHRQGK